MTARVRERRRARTLAIHGAQKSEHDEIEHDNHHGHGDEEPREQPASLATRSGLRWR
jgi:hypothetical protein